MLTALKAVTGLATTPWTTPRTTSTSTPAVDVGAPLMAPVHHGFDESNPYGGEVSRRDHGGQIAARLHSTVSLARERIQRGARTAGGSVAANPWIASTLALAGCEANTWPALLGGLTGVAAASLYIWHDRKKNDHARALSYFGDEYDLAILDLRVCVAEDRGWKLDDVKLLIQAARTADRILKDAGSQKGRRHL